MGLRDSLKQRIKKRVTSDPVAAAGHSTERAARGVSRVRDRAAELRARAEAIDAGQNPQDEDGLRSQAARAEEVATMTAPVNARLDPIDVPHPFEDERQRGSTDTRRQDQETMEDLVFGTGMDDTAEDQPVGLVFDDGDDDDEPERFFRGL